MATRTPQERALDNALVERALGGKLIVPYDRSIHTKTVGVTSTNPDGTSRQDVIAKLRQFETVEIERNPDDHWDSNAIKVMATYFEEVKVRVGEIPAGLRRVQIGHLDKDVAAELAPAIDAGEQWRAIITKVGGKISLGVSLMLYRLVPPAAGSEESSDSDSGPSIHALTCKKCGHGSDPARPWIPRKFRRPKVCARCKNRNWDRSPKRSRKAIQRTQ